VDTRRLHSPFKHVSLRAWRRLKQNDYPVQATQSSLQSWWGISLQDGSRTSSRPMRTCGELCQCLERWEGQRGVPRARRSSLRRDGTRSLYWRHKPDGEATARMKTIKTDEYVLALLKKCNQDLADHFKSDVIAIRAPIRFGLDDVIRYEIENLHDNKKKRPNRLTVLIETTGGYVEVVERIYNIFRRQYPDHVDFIVPNYAYSAGTVLVLSGDDIYMDYYSILGPIDPQYRQRQSSCPVWWQSFCPVLSGVAWRTRVASTEVGMSGV
jgi:hypothetical protein